MSDVLLQCVACEQEFPLSTVNSRCGSCDEPLEIRFLPERRSFPAFESWNNNKSCIFSRYGSFYPYLQDRALSGGLGEGRTPLVRSLTLGKETGLRSLHFKNETQNPTWSFKDRGTACTVKNALTLDFDRLGVVSSGNMGASVAAYGGRAGMVTYVIVKENVSQEKIDSLAVYGANMYRLLGNFRQLPAVLKKIGENNSIYFSMSDDPFRIEGYKTLSFEIFEQTRGVLPDYVFVPLGSGGLFRGVLKGFEELYQSGVTAMIPKIVGVQTKGCSPTVDAYSKGKLSINQFSEPNTLDHVLENPYPPSGNQVLRKVSKNGGFLLKVDDSQILSAIRKLGKEGIFAQPASATTIAGVIQAVKSNLISNNAKVTAVITGSGLKHMPVLKRFSSPIKAATVSDLGALLF